MVGRGRSLVLTSADDSIAARRIGGPAYPEMIEEIDRELTNVIEDFDRAMDFEALRLANETSKLSIFLICLQLILRGLA